MHSPLFLLVQAEGICDALVQRWSRCAARKTGRAQKKRAAIRQCVTGEPFDQIGIDISGPYNLSGSGNKYVFVVSDYFRKWVELLSNEGYGGKDTQTLVEGFISRMGVPMIINSDQGRKFESKFSSTCVISLG